MFRLAADVQVYLHREAIDFRIGINGLAILVEQAMHLDPFGRAVFGFCNRRRDRIRLLFYDRSGFWLMMKRLEADRFAWPRGQQQAVVRLSSEQLHWLLEGIDIEAVPTASGAAVSQRRLTLKDTASAQQIVLDKVGGFRFKDSMNRAAITEELTSLIAAHAAEIAALKAENETLAQRVIHLEEQLRLERLHRYAPRSEKLKDRIFNEAEQAAAEGPQTDDVETARVADTGLADAEQPEPKKRGRRPLPDSLPRERVEHDLPEEQKVCSCCRNRMHQMGEIVSEQLHIEVKSTVLQHVRFKYACRHCERTALRTPIVTAAMPPQPLPGSIAAPSTLALVLANKYVDGTPLYRLEQALGRANVSISRGALGNWMIRSVDLHLLRLYEALKQKLRAQPLVHGDETWVQVL